MKSEQEVKKNFNTQFFFSKLYYLSFYLGLDILCFGIFLVLFMVLVVSF